MIASKKVQEYFDTLQIETKRAYEVAEKARSMGFDPERRVDVPLAANMAERVAGLISLAAPQLDKSALANRITELEKEFEQLDWRVALKAAEEVTREKFCTFKTKEEAMEVGIRVGFAYLTLGIVSAPLEGFIGIKIKKRQDGKEYMAVYYAGPVRGAGGTAAATSVILSDYIRTIMGYAPYDPTEAEVSRFVAEIADYHERVTNLQYRPSDEEIKFLVRHIPIQIDGDPTEEIEVSNHKDLPRIETNRIRGGICLVLAEGVAQKSPKIWKRLNIWGKAFNLNWEFLQEFLDLQKKIKAQSQVKTDSAAISPNFTYIADIVAGRPVLGHPMKEGGFRLRYGRTRTTGFSAAGLHPASMYLLNKYIAIGTQLKLERPGKAAAITSCDTIEAPIVKLKNGSVKQYSDITQKGIISEVQEILYMGDILISYGDFSENNHKLVPAGYCAEWWIREVEKACIALFQSIDLPKITELCAIDQEQLQQLFSDPISTKISYRTARILSDKLKVPLHPSFTYYWQATNAEQLTSLLNWSNSAKYDRSDDDRLIKIILPLSESFNAAKRALELIGITHDVINNEFVVISGDDAAALYDTLQLEKVGEIKSKLQSADIPTLQFINSITPFVLRDKAGTFIGARMGRPEKAKMRKLAGSPHLLFPVGDEGDRLRSFQAALKAGKVTSDFPIYYCNPCKLKTIYSTCEECMNPTQRRYNCKECGESEKQTCSHGEKVPFKRQELDIKAYFERALKRINITTYPDQVKGVRGTANKDHVVEHMAKGIIRAKHGIYVNKDGTTRYDMTELPMTHFKPKEIGTPIERLRELGYTTDAYGNLLTSSDQLCELKVQDIVLPSNENSLDESSKKVMFRIAKFIDELLVRFYNQPSYYNFQKEDDIIGHLVVGLAPHISAGLIGRVIGFTETQGCFAHPMWHAGLRRDCDGDENCVMLLLDALLNFSRQYLPNMRGAKTMDSPLVLTSILVPSEVDDQSHGLDVAWNYHLELYEAALQYKGAGDVKIDQIRKRLNTEKQYEGFGFTHCPSNVNLGVKCSAYKTIPTMEEKLRGQVDLATKIRAVKADDVARLVIEKHFMKDIKGNLRQFSMQQFRCGQCNEKFKRPPLIGKCPECGGKLLFTVTEGSVTKYLQHSINLANDFHLSPYLIQSLEIVKRRIRGVFGKEKEKQSGLKAWAT